jgi:D-tyrosyl-tRNA(Tyr) deacylase
VRALLQRVSRAEVRVDGSAIGAIGRGLVVLLGVGPGDDERTAEALARQVAELRIFRDSEGRTNRSLIDVGGGALVVSQFTLYGDAQKGRRPSFIDALEPVEANRLYELCCTRLREQGLTVGTGVFRADMKVGLINDGPVTLLLESPRKLAA